MHNATLYSAQKRLLISKMRALNIEDCEIIVKPYQVSESMYIIDLTAATNCNIDRSTITIDSSNIIYGIKNNDAELTLRNSKIFIKRITDNTLTSPTTYGIHNSNGKINIFSSTIENDIETGYGLYNLDH